MRVYLSWGMGVESTAILVRWLLEPESRYVVIGGERVYFELSDLVVVTSQLGSEHADTKRHCEELVLPMLRAERVRMVQTARAGHLEEDGIYVLEDTREPYVMHTRPTPERPYYTLAQELLENGTIPQSAGDHWCALKFKAWVNELFLCYDVVGGDGAFAHAFGYGADEPERIVKSEAGIETRRIKAGRTRRADVPPLRRVVFGFAADEPERIARARAYDADRNRLGCYPLEVWQWTRRMCIEYLRLALGVTWLKSACGWCPFNELVYSHKKYGRGGIERLEENLDVAVEGLLIETISLALNPRATLYRRVALRSLLNRATVVEEFERHLARSEWALYRVRRIYKGAGSADRCVERLFVGPQWDAIGELALRAEDGGRVHKQHGMFYLYRQERRDGSAEAGDREEYFVAAPALADSKSRYGLDWFETKWAEPAQAELFEVTV